MRGQQQSCSSFFLVLALVTAAVLFIMAFVPAWAQNPVPPTAREAAASPEVASHLARPATAAAAQPSPRTKPHSRSPQDTVIYENGPLNGTYDAFTINSGYTVSNSFTVSANTVTGFDFYTWSYPGDTPTNVDWSITAAENGGIVYGSGTGATLTNTVISTNGYGYQINLDTVSGLNVTLPAGTYWVNLQNAVTSQGNPLYWDENDGVGCKSTGCPSLASDSGVGTIGSETFDITSSTTTSCGGGSGSFQVVYNFTGGADGAIPNAATMDQFGNIYGTNSGNCYGDGCKGGIVYKLTNLVSGWVLTPLYDFGKNEYARLIGPDGSLYGTTSDRGINDCNGNGCGTVFNLKPPPTAPPSVFAPWRESTIYKFAGGNDAANPYGDLVFDQSGNLYGATATGGAYGLGAIYKLTPSNGSWTESVLYSFAGGGDGTAPSAVVADKVGNLYGTAHGGLAAGTVFQLSPSGSGWTKKIIHSFMCGVKGQGCLPVIGLTIDGSGNLYGATSYGWDGWVAFMLTPSNGDWTYAVIYVDEGNYYSSPIDRLVLDTAGNLYGAIQHACSDRNRRQKLEGCQLPLAAGGSVFSLSSGTWTYTLLHKFCGNDGSNPINLMLDGKGHLFGTADGGGKGQCDGGSWRGCGVVFEITP